MLSVRKVVTRAILLAATLAVLGAPAQAAEPGSVSDIEDRITRSRTAMSELKSRFDLVATMETELETGLSQALVMLEVGDPDRAAVRLLDIVSREEWKAKPGYRHAMFLLAQAYYDSGHYVSARNQLMKVISDGRPEDYQPAVELVIETAIATGNWTGVDEIYEALEATRGNNARPELLYARGKGLYVEGRYEEAIAAFNRIQPSTLTGLLARYYAGVTRVRLGRIDEARADFVAVVERAPEHPEEQAEDLLDLGHLAVARMHYELAEWNEALDTYNRIEIESRHFDQALYEMTWIHIRRAEDDPDNQPRHINAAIEKLEMLRIARPDSLFAPDAQRLEADLLKEKGNYEDALRGYETLIADFEPVLVELDAMVEGQPDRTAYFQELVASDELGRAQYVPMSAAKWVVPDQRMQNASAMVTSLVRSSENIEEAWALIDEVEAAVESDNRYELFPEARGAWVAALGRENTLLGILRDLNRLEGELLDLSNDDPARAERLAAEDGFTAIPQSREAYLERERALKIAFEERQHKAFRLRNDLSAANALIEQIERWILLQGAREMTDEETAELTAELEAASTLADAMHVELKVLERELRVASSLGGIDADLVAREAEARKAYKLALLAERDSLEARSGGNGDARARIKAARKDTEALMAELETYRGQVVTVVDAKVAKVREVLREEKANLDEYAKRHVTDEGNVELVAGEIALHHWERVRTLFADLVLAADVGVVDVAWLKKDALSREVDSLIASRNKEREVLDQDFKQVLRELGEKSEEK